VTLSSDPALRASSTSVFASRSSGVSATICLDRVVVERIGHAIAAQHEDVAPLDHPGGGVGLDGAVEAHRLREDVLVREQPGQLGREPPGVDLLLHHGVIARQPREPAVAEQVRAAVAHVREVRLIAVDHQHHQRGAHPAGLGPELRLPPDADRRLVHGVPQPLPEDVRRVLRLVVADQPGLVRIGGPDQRLVHRLDGHPGRDLACGVPSHAVRHHEHAGREVDVPGVFVVSRTGPVSDRA
jgi:hypothetical protein